MSVLYLSSCSGQSNTITWESRKLCFLRNSVTSKTPNESVLLSVVTAVDKSIFSVVALFSITALSPSFLSYAYPLLLSLSSAVFFILSYLLSSSHDLALALRKAPSFNLLDLEKTMPHPLCHCTLFTRWQNCPCVSLCYCVSVSTNMHKWLPLYCQLITPFLQNQKTKQNKNSRNSNKWQAWVPYIR